MAARKKPVTREPVSRTARAQTPDERLGAVRDVLGALVAEPGSRDVLDVVCESIEKALGLGSIDIYEYDPRREELRVTWSYMSFDPKQATEFVGTSYSLATHPSFRRALEPAAVVVYDVDDDELARAEPALHGEMVAWGEHTVVETGLFFAGEPLGVLSVGSVDDSVAWGDEDDRRLLLAFAAAAALAMYNRHASRVVEQLAVSDGLTGLYNHRAFFERFESELARGRRYDTPVALALVDIDDFKSYNERYGRKAGDEALCAIGRLLVAEVRRDLDIVCRYGGQEFAVILPNTPLTGREVGERLRQRIGAASLTSDDGADLGTLTVSVGVSVFPGALTSAESLVNAAEQAVFVAKKAGRNRVEVVGQP